MFYEINKIAAMSPITNKANNPMPTVIQPDLKFIFPGFFNSSLTLGVSSFLVL